MPIAWGDASGDEGWLASLELRYAITDWQLTLAWRGSQEGKAEPDKKMRAWAQAGWRF